uniref:NADH dehydrogenase subunit 4L n=1 Tax=Dermacentor nitens TaxID=60253 RepID=V9MLV0_DERNI|nr:NADH dehydrogenase subunit 4L [Dermacentor nitens]AGH19703.1 NADH dehydrogenase subunit 4L [Dermacentor nitens]
MMISIMILYMIGFASLFVNRFYMMMILLSIEFMYMSLLLMMCIYFSFFNILTIFVFLVSIVCEAGLGMSLLVLMSYFFGNEMVKSMSLVKC